VWNYRQISPGSVSVGACIDILIIAVVGGITRPIGPFVGALIFVLLRTFALDFLVKLGLDGNRFRLLIGLGFLAIVFWSSDGIIGFFGEDVTHFPPYERIRRGLRRTYQISALFPGLTVQDNVYLACRGVSRGRFSFLRPGQNDALMHAADNLVRAVHLTGVKD